MLKKIKTKEQLRQYFKTLYDHGVFDEKWIVDAVLHKFGTEFNHIDELSQKAFRLRDEIRKFMDTLPERNDGKDGERLCEFEARGLDLLDDVSLPQYLVCYIYRDGGRVVHFADFYSAEEIEARGAMNDLERFLPDRGKELLDSFRKRFENKEALENNV